MKYLSPKIAVHIGDQCVPKCISVPTEYTGEISQNASEQAIGVEEYPKGATIGPKISCVCHVNPESTVPSVGTGTQDDT